MSVSKFFVPSGEIIKFDVKSSRHSKTNPIVSSSCSARSSMECTVERMFSKFLMHSSYSCEISLFSARGARTEIKKFSGFSIIFKSNIISIFRKSRDVFY